MKIKKNKTIVICSSASFYKQVVEVEKQLKDLGFKVVIPLTAKKMKQMNNFDPEVYKTWYKNPYDYKRKAYLTRKHFNEVENGDCILVTNYNKNGKDGYIGGAVLGEMNLAFYLKRPIYILNPLDETSIFEEELYGMFPIILNGDLSKMK
jgi:hypothetical protein